MGANKSKEEYVVEIECFHVTSNNEIQQAYMKRPASVLSLTDDEYEDDDHHDRGGDNDDTCDVPTPPPVKKFTSQVPPPANEQDEQSLYELAEYSLDSDDTDDTDDSNSDTVADDRNELPQFLRTEDEAITQQSKTISLSKRTIRPYFDGESDSEYMTNYSDHPVVDQNCYQEALNGYNPFVPFKCITNVKRSGIYALNATTVEALFRSKYHLKSLVKELIKDSTEIGTFLNVKYLAWLIDLYAYQHRLRRKYLVCEYINNEEKRHASGLTYRKSPDETEHGRPIVIKINNLHFLKGDLLHINIHRAVVLAHEMAHGAYYILAEKKQPIENGHGPGFKLHADHISEFTGLKNISNERYDASKLITDFSFDHVRPPVQKGEHDVQMKTLYDVYDGCKT